MAILSKERKPDSFESHKYLKLTFTNISGLRSNVAGNEPNSPDILALCETNLDHSIDPGNFSVGCIFLQSRRIQLDMCMV